MNKTTLLLTLLLTAGLAGCVGDDGMEIMTHEGIMAPGPSYDNVQPAGPVTGLEFITQLQNESGALPTGAGAWVFGDFAFVSARTERFFIADVSDPTDPQLVYQAPADAETFYARDADFITHDDGRRTLVLATQFDGMHFWDVTDPTQPEFLSQIFVDPNHNVAVIPGTSFVFNSQSGGEGRSNEIVDATDPLNPRLAGNYGTHGCHDITFFGSYGDEKFRAYCAGIDRTEIWDLTGFNPDILNNKLGITLVGTVTFGPDQPVIAQPGYNTYPARTLHHLAMVNEDASILIIGDEFNGGGTPGACYAYEENTGASTPYGALWFYSLADETAPELLSWITPPMVQPETNSPTPDPADVQEAAEEFVDDQRPGHLTGLARPYTTNVPNCTAHFGSLVPGEEKLVMAWYSAGILLINFTDPAAPRILDQVISEGTNPWDARIHGGYIFTGDIGRGMDVLRLV